MNKKNLFAISVFATLIFIFSFIKLNFFAGSHKIFFSGINLIFPVLGGLLSTSLSSIFVLLFFLFKKVTLGGAITLGLPTLIATISFSIMTKNNENRSLKLEVYNFLLRVVLPLLAMALFILNPIGKQAFIYSFYWLIPVSLYFLEKLTNNHSIFFKSLSTTFIAHAIGSLIWLYMVPTTSIYWISLIPVVFIERIIFSLGIIFTFHVLKYFKLILNKKTCLLLLNKI